MEVANATFYASTDDALAPPPGAVRVRRLPLTAGGAVALDMLASATAAVGTPPSSATSGPLIVARSYTEEPLALILGEEKLGAVADASTAARGAAGPGPSSHAKGLTLPSAADGGPRELSTMCDALRDAAEHAPSSCGITYVVSGEAKFESYAELLGQARRMLEVLTKQLGLRQGHVIGLQIAETRVHLSAFWGCALGGIAPVTVAMPNQYAPGNATVLKLLGALSVLDVKHVLSSARGVAPLQALVPSHVRVHDALLLRATAAAPSAALDVSLAPTDVLFYQLTSGSTGTPKCIPERHGAVVSHIRHSAHHCGYSADDVTLNWLPFDHVVPILTFHLCDVYLHRRGVQLPTDEIVASPLRWPQAMAEYKVTHSWAPNFGFTLGVQAARATGQTKLHYDLTRVKRLMNAGEQVTAEACATFAHVFGLAPAVIQPAFGMAECCTCMTYNNAFDAVRSTVRVLKSSLQAPVLELSSAELTASASASASATVAASATFVSLGGVSPGVEIRICSADETVLNELQIGRFQIRGPCVMAGYHRNPKANEECMLAEGWLDTGDVGFVHQGELVLTGRAKEMIILRGANFYCYEVEAAVYAAGGVAPARVAATSVRDESEGTEKLIVFFVPESGTHAAAAVPVLHEHGVLLGPLRDLVAAVRSQVGSALGLTARYALPLDDKDFRRTTSGKIQRTAHQKAFLSGEYARATEALDLGLGSSDLAAPDFFAEVTWVRKQPLLTAAPTGVGAVVCVAPAELHEALASSWAAQAAQRPLEPSAVAGLVLVDGDDGAALRHVLGGAGAASAGITHVVHATMLYRGGGEAAAEAAGRACATLCELARALEASPAAERQLRLLCLRSEPAATEPAAQLACASAGGALAPGLCKALARELGAVASSAVVEMPCGVTVDQVVAVMLVELLGGSPLDEEVRYRELAGADGGDATVPCPPSPPTTASPWPWSGPTTALYRHVKRFASVGRGLQAEARAAATRAGSTPPDAGGGALGTPPPLLHASRASGSVVVVSGGLGALGVGLVQLLLAEMGTSTRVLLLGRRSAAAVSQQLEALGWTGPASRVAYAAVDLGSSDVAYDELLAALRAAIAPFEEGGGARAHGGAPPGGRVQARAARRALRRGAAQRRARQGAWRRPSAPGVCRPRRGARFRPLRLDGVHLCGRGPGRVRRRQRLPRMVCRVAARARRRARACARLDGVGGRHLEP